MKFAVLLLVCAVSTWALPVHQNAQSPGKVEDLKDRLQELRSDLQTEDRTQRSDQQARVQAILEKFPVKDRAALKTFVQHKLKYLKAILGNSATEKREESGPGPEPQAVDDAKIALMPGNGAKDRKIFISRELEEEPEEEGPGPEPKRAYLAGEKKVFVSRELEHEPEEPAEEAGPGPEPKRVYLGGDKKVFVSRELDHEYEDPQAVAQQRGAKLIISRELEEDFDQEQVDADPHNYPESRALPASDTDRKLLIARELENEDEEPDRKLLIARELENEDEEPEPLPVFNDRKLLVSRELEEVPQENIDEELKAIAQQMSAEDFRLLRNLRSKLLLQMNDEEIAKREEPEVQPLPTDPYAELKALVDQMGPHKLAMLKDMLKKAKDIVADLDEKPDTMEEEVQETKRSGLPDISQDLGTYAEKLGKKAREYLESHPEKLQEVKDILEQVRKGKWNDPSDESDLAPVEKEGEEKQTQEEAAVEETKRSELPDISQDLGTYAEKLGKGAMEYLENHPDKLQEVKDILEEVRKGKWNNPSDESDLAPVEKQEEAAVPIQVEDDRALNNMEVQELDATQDNSYMQQEASEGTFGEIIDDQKRDLNEPQPVENQQPGIWDEQPAPPEELGKEPETETEEIGERLLNDIDAARREGVDVKELLGVLEERKQELKNTDEQELEALIAP